VHLQCRVVATDSKAAESLHGAGPAPEAKRKLFVDPKLWQLLEAGDANDEIATIIRLADPAVRPPGIRIIAQFGAIATCRLKRGAIIETRTDKATFSLKAPIILIPEQEIVPPEWSQPSAEMLFEADDRRPHNAQETGRGIVVGVVDWGCDFAHPDFRNPDGTTRLLALWDQQAHPDPPAPNRYGYGRIHTPEKIDRALTTEDPYATLGYHPADSDPGRGAHGTHCLSIAAGNGRGGGPIGVAPEADLVFVHLATWGRDGLARLGDSVTLLEAVDFIARIAGSRPWVINLSMGRHAGEHDGLSPVEQGLDAAVTAAPGRMICHSTGNYYDRRIHSAVQLRPGEEYTLDVVTQPAAVIPHEIDIWYPGRDRLIVEVWSPDGAASARVPIGQRATLRIDGRQVGAVHHRAHDPNNNDHHIDIFIYPGAPAGIWQIKLIGEDVVDGRIHAWIERDAACRHCQPYFDLQDVVPLTTTGTICNGFHTIAVGAYNSHTPERELAPFSSSGPTRDGRPKPDCIAPGVTILAARSAPRQPRSDAPLLTPMSGTSMAAPHVTGTIALMFEARSGQLKPARCCWTAPTRSSARRKHWREWAVAD
jgi:hypothetical protein